MLGGQMMYRNDGSADLGRDASGPPGLLSLETGTRKLDVTVDAASVRANWQSRPARSQPPRLAAAPEMQERQVLWVPVR
jgi:hypothetical protein